MYTISEFDRLIQFLPVEIRPEVQVEIGSPDQSRVVQSLWRFPWQKFSRFAIDLSRWGKLNADQQKLFFLREAVFATELALGDNWSALLLYPALIGAGTMGILVELQLGDNLGMGLATGLAATAFFLLRKAERGQKPQIAADEFAVRYASQNGYRAEQAAAVLMGAIQQIAQLEDRVKDDYDSQMRMRNLEYMSQKGVSAGSLAVGPVKEAPPSPSGRREWETQTPRRDWDAQPRRDPREPRDQWEPRREQRDQWDPPRREQPPAQPPRSWETPRRDQPRYDAPPPPPRRDPLPPRRDQPQPPRRDNPPRRDSGF